MLIIITKSINYNYMYNLQVQIYLYVLASSVEVCLQLLRVSCQFWFDHVERRIVAVRKDIQQIIAELL